MKEILGWICDRSRQGPGITWSELCCGVISTRTAGRVQEPALKDHLNKNTFLNELVTIDLEYKMEMDSMLITMNLSAC